MQIGKWPCTSPVILTDADQSFAFDMTSRSHGWRDENTNSRLAANDPNLPFAKASIRPKAVTQCVCESKANAHTKFRPTITTVGADQGQTVSAAN